MVRQYVLEMSWQGVLSMPSSRQDDCKILQLFQMKKGFDECNLHPRQTSCSKLSSHKVSIIVLPYSLKFMEILWPFVSSRFDLGYKMNGIPHGEEDDVLN